MTFNTSGPVACRDCGTMIGRASFVQVPNLWDDYIHAICVRCYQANEATEQAAFEADKRAEDRNERYFEERNWTGFDPRA